MPKRKKKDTKPQTPLTREDVTLLWQLQAELPRLRASVKSARTIGTYSGSRSRTHPALAFAFNRAPAAVIETLLLRLSEALDLFLNRASIQFLGVPLGKKVGRSWQPDDPDFNLLLRLRDYRVAHLVKLRTHADQAYEEMKERHATPYDFLSAVLDKIEALIADLEEAGLFEPREGLVASFDIEREFTEAQLEELLNVANQLPAATA